MQRVLIGVIPGSLPALPGSMTGMAPLHEILP